MPRSYFALMVNSMVSQASGVIAKISKLKWRLNGARNSRHHNFAANLMELFLLLRLQFEQSVSYTAAYCSDRLLGSRVPAFVVEVVRSLDSIARSYTIVICQLWFSHR